MNSKIENNEHQRVCTRCSTVKKLNSDNFYISNGRPHGFSYVCKPCERERSRIKTIKHPRIDSYKRMSQEAKDNKSSKCRIYAKTDKGRAICLVSAYRKIDRKKGREFDLDSEFMINSIFNKECHYCGDNSSDKGCDRMNNAIGHIKSNVVPCCRYCNTLRGDSYTMEEMMLIGEVIDKIKKSRRDKLL